MVFQNVFSKEQFVQGISAEFQGKEKGKKYSFEVKLGLNTLQERFTEKEKYGGVVKERRFSGHFNI